MNQSTECDADDGGRWPGPLDYAEALQHPSDCFADDDLRLAEPVFVGKQDLLFSCSGKFALVAKIRCPLSESYWAVKGSTARQDVPPLRRRYQAIRTHLRHARLPFLVDVELLEPG